MGPPMMMPPPPGGLRPPPSESAAGDSIVYCACSACAGPCTKDRYRPWIAPPVDLPRSLPNAACPPVPRWFRCVPPAVATGPPVRSTTLWVGRIASSVDAPFVQQLLEACGPVREWKPVTEPDTGRLKGFGFVTYVEPEGVMVALHVLNNLNVDGQELALKCNKVGCLGCRCPALLQRDRLAAAAVNAPAAGAGDW